VGKGLTNGSKCLRCIRRAPGFYGQQQNQFVVGFIEFIGGLTDWAANWRERAIWRAASAAF